MARLTFVIVSVAVASSSCQQAAQRSGSAASLAEICVALTGEFRIPPDPNGPPEGNQNSEAQLFRRLADPDIRERAEAAKKLLRHSERRVPAMLDSAIRVSGELGDPRVLNNLAKIATQWAMSNDPDGTRVAYPLTSRVAAAAALGRVLESNRSSPPGETDSGEGISADAKERAIDALKISGCIGEPTELRAAAIEALGISRSPAAKPYLDLTFQDPVAPDDFRTLLLQSVAGRSLTNIVHNNHLEDSDVDEQLRELLLNLQAQQGGQP